MSEIQTVFSGDYIDRCGELRTQIDQLEEAYHDPETRFLPVWRNLCFVTDGKIGFATHDDIAAHSTAADQAIFLGRRDGRYLFAVAINNKTPPDPLPQQSFIGLRALSGQIAENDAALIAYARAMIIWQRTHRHCGKCGSNNQALEGGFVMQCSLAQCGHRGFPRLDPAIIVLVHRGEKCLLGRQASWPVGRFSTIAGFVEPGESLEDAVRREVREETNIRTSRCHYLASQPWPFPAALMIGFHAEAVTDEIQLNDGELAEARWLTRDQIATGEVRISPRMSIAYRLIEAWFDAGPGPRLARLKFQ